MAPCAAYAVPFAIDPVLLDAFRRREAGAVRTLYNEYGRLVYAVCTLSKNETIDIDTWARSNLAEFVAERFANAEMSEQRLRVSGEPHEAIGPRLDHDPIVARRQAVAAPLRTRPYRTG